MSPTAFNSANPYASQRSSVMARNIVSSSQPLAAAAGAQMFARGGNAIDAAVAAAITLTVTEPTMNGIGSDGFSLIWDGERLHGLNSSGRSPAGWHRERFAGLSSMPMYGWDSVTVPGAVAQWMALSTKFGRLPFADLFEPAIRHARDGFAVAPIVARQWQAYCYGDLLEQPGFRQAFMHLGRAPRAGERWRFADQARTLQDIAESGGESFYRGRLAKAMADFSSACGGALTQADLAGHEANWVAPISQNYRGYTVHEIPPNGQGIAALIALGILERLPVKDTQPDCALRLHLQIEAMRLAFADAYAQVADPDSMLVTPAELLDARYLDARARLVDPKRAQRYPAGSPIRGGTVYLCAADQEGRMISLIQSNFKGFGSGVVVPGTGISMQNRGWGFSVQPGHPNEVGPRKRPFQTIIPAFMTRDGKPVMAFGVMGGNMQPQGHMQVVMRYLEDGSNPQACIDAPRWRINDDGDLTVEAAMPEATVAGLAALGHKVLVQPKGAMDFGSSQMIARLSDDLADGYVAGSDPRRDGHAAAM